MMSSCFPPPGREPRRDIFVLDRCGDVASIRSLSRCLASTSPPANFCCFARPTPSQPLGWWDAAAWWHSTNHHHAHFYVLGFTFAEHGATCTHIHFPAAKISNMTQLNAKSMLHTFSSKPKLFQCTGVQGLHTEDGQNEMNPLTINVQHSMEDQPFLFLIHCSLGVKCFIWVKIRNNQIIDYGR